MVTVEQAEKIDNILHNLVNNTSIKELEPEILSDILSFDYEEAYEIINKIILITFNGDSVVNYSTNKGINSPLIWAKSNTKSFLESGGCKALLKEKLKNQKDQKKEKLKSNLIIILTITGVIIAALALIWDIIKD